MVVSSRDQNLVRVENARQASAIFGLTSGYVNERISQTVQSMVSGYRSGEADFAFLLGKTAEISALMGLMSDLESVQRRGNEAAEKEFRNAP